MILTDEEIKEAVCGLDMQPHYRLEQTFEEAMLDYRAIEAAVLAKLSRDAEPTLHCPHCKVDRLKEPCPDLSRCKFVATAYKCEVLK
jgi:hypothetical protein